MRVTQHPLEVFHGWKLKIWKEEHSQLGFTIFFRVNQPLLKLWGGSLFEQTFRALVAFFKNLEIELSKKTSWLFRACRGWNITL